MNNHGVTPVPLPILSSSALLRLFFFPICFFASYFLLSTIPSFAQVPGIVNYQGEVTVNGTKFDGTGLFKFALVDAVGTTTHWSNDDHSTTGDEPLLSVSLSVANGLFSVGLGDITLTNMTIAIPTSVFGNTHVFLRVWFSDDGINPFELLTPDQRITAVGYALMADGVSDNTVTTPMIQNNAVTSAKIDDNTITESDLDTTSIDGRYVNKAGDTMTGNLDLGNNDLVTVGNVISSGTMATTGSVGAGTTSPGAKLHIAGTPGVDGLMFPDGTLQTTKATEAASRIPISALPFTINDPGSYYLTTNLTGIVSSAGITISASDVTLDLNGFALNGVFGSLEGVNVPATQHNIEVRNGTIQSWGFRAVDATNADNSLLVGLRVYSNGLGSSRGGLRVGKNSLINSCVIEANVGDGIVAGDGSTVSGCVALDNSFDGIEHCTVSECTVSNSGGTGIYANIGCAVSGCNVFNSVGDGVRVSTGSSVVDCIVTSNAVDGVEAADKCRVVKNTCTDNLAGIHLIGPSNRIEGNHVTGNVRGLDIDSVENYVSDNTVVKNNDNYAIVAGNQLNLLLGEIPESIDWSAMVKLAGTLTGTSGNSGITINTSDVTIDLDGHALVGVVNSSHGIFVPTNQQDITIRNGTIRDWGLLGINALLISNGQYQDLRLSGNGLGGLSCGENSTVSECTARSNGSAGITVSDGSTVDKCSASSNGAEGIRAGSQCVVIDCSARSNFVSGISIVTGSTISGCNSSFNGQAGILTGSDCTIDRCVGYSNSFDGIRAGFSCVIRGCVATGNTVDGIDASAGSVISECTARENGDDGITTGGSTVIDCMASFNVGDGISLGSDCRVVDNTCFGNGTGGDGAGIRFSIAGNRIENNHVTDNVWGIKANALTTFGTLIVRNTASGNTGTASSGGADAHFDFDPILNPHGVIQDISALAGGAIPSTHVNRNWFY